MTEPIHLKPAAELAPRVLLPGDPHRSLAVAQDLLEAPRMFNHHRGLWGYTGIAADGLPMSVQATGMGGPSAAIVAEELVDLGAEVLVRIGTCGALDSSLRVGDVVAVTEAIATDGTSRALGAGERIAPDPDLAAALAESAGQTATAMSVDLFYGERPEPKGGRPLNDSLVVEMEAAAVFAVASKRGVRAGCLLGVSDQLAGPERVRIAREELESLGLELGRRAYATLAATR
ncbi:MAG: purine-nucleoside phosphorylase [Thermoleophilaceae bacterium]|nr:purine-nucleoside phosphorylase [Thermoleophilaceae bacterium]